MGNQVVWDSAHRIDQIPHAYAPFHQLLLLPFQLPLLPLLPLPQLFHWPLLPPCQPFDQLFPFPPAWPPVSNWCIREKRRQSTADHD